MGEKRILQTAIEKVVAELKSEGIDFEAEIAAEEEENEDDEDERDEDEDDEEDDEEAEMIKQIILKKLAEKAAK